MEGTIFSYFNESVSKFQIKPEQSKHVFLTQKGFL